MPRPGWRPCTTAWCTSVHAQEGATAGDAGIDAEDLDAARAVGGRRLERLAARDVPAEGQVLLHATDHGTVRLVAEYANHVGAVAIVLGAPTTAGARPDGRQRQPGTVAARPQQRPDHQPAGPVPAAETRREPAHAG